MLFRSPRPRIVPCPAAPIIGLARLTPFLPFLPRIEPDEVRRLLEDKAFDISGARKTLGFAPISLAEGLARTFARAG